MVTARGARTRQCPSEQALWYLPRCVRLPRGSAARRRLSRDGCPRAACSWGLSEAMMSQPCKPCGNQQQCNDQALALVIWIRAYDEETVVFRHAGRSCTRGDGILALVRSGCAFHTSWTVARRSAHHRVHLGCPEHSESLVLLEILEKNKGSKRTASTTRSTRARVPGSCTTCRGPAKPAACWSGWARSEFRSGWWRSSP